MGLGLFLHRLTKLTFRRFELGNLVLRGEIVDRFFDRCTRFGELFCLSGSPFRQVLGGGDDLVPNFFGRLGKFLRGVGCGLCGLRCRGIEIGRLLFGNPLQIIAGLRRFRSSLRRVFRGCRRRLSQGFRSLFRNQFDILLPFSQIFCDRSGCGGIGLLTLSQCGCFLGNGPLFGSSPLENFGGPSQFSNLDG